MTLRRLPDGTTTTSVSRYTTAWKVLGNKMADILGGQLGSFDPGFQIIVQVEGSMQVFNVPVWAAQRIVDYVDDQVDAAAYR